MGKSIKRESPRDDNASTSSAVLLDNIDYHDEEDLSDEDHEDLPAYEDDPVVVKPMVVAERIKYI